MLENGRSIYHYPEVILLSRKMVDPGGCTPAKKVQQIRKKLILGFWHLPMQNFMLSSKITSFLGVRASERRRKHLKLVILYFFTSAGKPTGCTGLPGSPGKIHENSGRPRQASAASGLAC